MTKPILIVEDHQAVRQSLRRWLELEFPQRSVIQAASGEEGVQMARRESPRLVVVDIKLPGMSGIEAIRQIKAVQPSAQCVVLSIHDDDAHRAEAAAAGASAYVSKRAMQAELIPTLAGLLAGTNGSSPAT